MKYFENFDSEKSKDFFVNLFRDEKKYDETLSNRKYLEVAFSSEEEKEIIKQIERDTW